MNNAALVCTSYGRRLLQVATTPCLWMLLASSNSSIAQKVSPASDGHDEVQEIVVTGARLRNESAQEAPIAVSVVDASFIESLQGSNTSALSAVIPNLVIYE